MASHQPAARNTDSLSWALLHAARVCVSVRGGQALPEALKAELAGCEEFPARGAVQDLCYRTMRNRGRADALLQTFADRVPKPPLLRELLVVALTLLDRHGPTGLGEPLRYAPFTVVDQAVLAAHANPELRRAKNFVNAVLRSFLRERERADHAVPASAAVSMNYPAWWVERVQRAYPEDWQAILASGQEHPPLTVRVNRRAVSVTDYLTQLAEAGMQAEQVGPVALMLARAVPVRALPGFQEGLVSVQDEAAQRAAPLLGVLPGQRVLDACAAPGGKTCHVLEEVDAQVTALDLDAGRLARVSSNLDRLGLVARLVQGDAGHPEQWWDGVPFERILADLPCTASGIVRRHPDIRWLRRPSDSTALSRQQQQILDALWRLLAPDGKLLIVTCSIFPEEGQFLARDFAMRHPDAAPQPTWGQLVPTSGPAIDHDGLFFALFDKIA
jgi:16S rRNA (cytosine967-C5)-methyltransferase